MGVTGGHTGEGAAAQARIIGGSVVTVMTTVAVMITVVVAADGGVEAAGMITVVVVVSEEGVGMVAALQGVQEARLGRAARSAGPRLNNGTVKGRKSKGEHLGKGIKASIIR